MLLEALLSDMVLTRIITGQRWSKRIGHLVHSLCRAGQMNEFRHHTQEGFRIQRPETRLRKSQTEKYHTAVLYSSCRLGQHGQRRLFGHVRFDGDDGPTHGIRRRVCSIPVVCQEPLRTRFATEFGKETMVTESHGTLNKSGAIGVDQFLLSENRTIRTVEKMTEVICLARSCGGGLRQALRAHSGESLAFAGEARQCSFWLR